MIEKTNRPINFRPIMLCAISLMLGIILFRYSPTLGAWTLILPIILALVVGSLFFFFGDKKNRVITLFITAICLLSAFVGIGVHAINVDLTTAKVIPNGSYTVVGEVADVSYKDGKYNVGLKNCSYDNISGCDIFIYGLDKEVGLYDVLSLNCYVLATDEIHDGAYSYLVESGYGAMTNSIYSVEIIGKASGIASIFKTKTDESFKKVLGEDYGILSAMLRGDVSGMKETVSVFRMVGIAHVFAVSGMHIGLIFTALAFIMSKIPIAKGLKTFITCGALLFYSYLCGFTPSSLRAVIMCSCMAIAKLYGEKYDGLNAMSESAIIVLILKPTDLFSAGFILSYAISLSIIVLAPPIKEIFKFLPEKFASGISVLCASQIVALPLSVLFFKSFSIISFIANFVLLPVVSIVFYAVVIGTVITLILPINELIALFIPQILIIGIKGITEFFAQVPLIINYFPPILALFYYSLVLVASDFVNAPKKVKISCAIIDVLIVLFVAICSFWGIT